MILIDSVFVHNGGGKVLLNYLMAELSKQTLHQICFLFDSRMKSEINKIEGSEYFFADGFKDRCKFYDQHGNRFRKIFCLGNIAPHKKQRGFVINYLHSSLYLTANLQKGILGNISMFAKKVVFNKLRGNVDLWMVQTEVMKRMLTESKNVKNDKILVIPFYKSLFSLYGEESLSTTKRIKDTFLFPSIPSAHKNHDRLIEAFCKAYDLNKKGELQLTIGSQYPEFYQKIKELNEKGYPITDLGYLDRPSLSKHFAAAEFVINPSLRESFGLILIEGCEFGNKIISCDEPYVGEICKPSLNFNAHDANDISRAITTAMETELPESKLLIQNEMEKLVEKILES
ncbi:glycosyltransferase [Candidatus Kaistella beijingensis]|jgi:glycosyltransferase involved in cell wall biosynthesis|uniref:glycosyltransferase n=1 Tax=Candidatus Kaistella beijingensis TaxID=2820270 RepID=UPI001CC56B08|nr:glycosyltransferase [Candidatus Kaistella beijingensis]UBB90959.1 glycosyltransferase [Candidatus Kaistella beijingensis]